MNTQVVEGACAFAWRNYLLLHAGVSENDDRRAALSSYATAPMKSLSRGTKDALCTFQIGVRDVSELFVIPITFARVGNAPDGATCIISD